MEAMPGRIPLSFTSSLATTAPPASRTTSCTTRSSSACLPRLAMRKSQFIACPYSVRSSKGCAGTTVTSSGSGCEAAAPSASNNQASIAFPQRRTGLQTATPRRSKRLRLCDHKVGMSSPQITLQTVTGVDVELTIDGPGSRSYAFIIDWHIRLLVALAWVLAGLLIYGGGGLQPPPDPGPGYLIGVWVPPFFIYFFYHPVLELAM